MKMLREWLVMDGSICSVRSTYKWKRIKYAGIKYAGIKYAGIKYAEKLKKLV